MSQALPKIQFRLLLVNHKLYLKALYKGKNSRAVIKRSNTEELNLIGRICNYICNGIISMFDKTDVNVLRQKRKLQVLIKNFKSQDSLEKYLAQSREDKILTILALKVAFPVILKRLFVKK